MNKIERYFNDLKNEPYSVADEAVRAIQELQEELSRCYFKKPLDKDGNPIELGETYYGGDGRDWVAIAYLPGKYEVAGEHSYIYKPLKAKWLTRSKPQPEVLDADGVPIKVGDVVYLSDSPNDASSDFCWEHGGALIVERQNLTHPGFFICRNDLGNPIDCCCKNITHKEPDTQEKIDADAKLGYCDYFKAKGVTCDDCINYENRPECDTSMIKNLLHRQRELDKRLMGGE